MGRCVYFEWIRTKWPTERIERITGVRVPEYKIIEYDRGKRSFTGDYLDRYIIEFKTMPSEKMFDEIDKKVASGNTGWVKDGVKYRFSVMWGFYCPAPKGEDEETDCIFKISLTKGEKRGNIMIGMW